MMSTGVEYDICRTQSRIYQYVAESGYNVEKFSDAFLKSDFCRRAFDTLYSRFQLEDVLECMDFIVPEIQNQFIKDNSFFDEEVSAWIGFVYRQLYIETQIYSRDLQEKVSFVSLCRYYPGLHTIDPEDATDIICKDFSMQKKMEICVF